MFWASKYLQEGLFKEFIRPFLRNEPDANYYSYFREQAYRLWVLQFSPADVEKINVLQKAYVELCCQDAALFVELANKVFSRIHDSRTIVEESAREYDLIAHDNHTQKAFKKGFEYYKSLFESEFALGISLFYAWVVECHKPALKNPDTDYVSVPASQKRKTLEDQKFTVVIDGIDHKIRNAGSGHESWEVTDEGECIYKDIDPKTWKVKETFQISTSDLRNEIKKIEKATAIIDLSLNIFLSNNPNIQIGYSILGIRPKISEIERIASKIGLEYQLGITKFAFEKDRSHLDLEIIHYRASSNIGATQVFSNLWAHEVVKMRWGVSYIDQVFWILFQIIHLNEGKVFEFHLKITEEGKWSIYEGVFETEELQRWINESAKGKKFTRNQKMESCQMLHMHLLLTFR